MKIQFVVAATILFLVGVACGGYLFSESVPRPTLVSTACSADCYSAKNIAGLITSVLLLHAPFLIPGVVLESDTCLSVRYPRAKARIHYVLFPKHDVKNIATLTPEDTCMGTMSSCSLMSWPINTIGVPQG